MELMVRNLTEKSPKSENLSKYNFNYHSCKSSTKSTNTKTTNDNKDRSFLREFLHKTKSILPSSSCRADADIDHIPVKESCKCVRRKSDSLYPEDVDNLRKIDSLVKKERDLTTNIDQLWEKEKYLGNIMRDFKNRTTYTCICSFADSTNTNDITKENIDLKIKNDVLKLELEEMTTNIKESLQNVELPAQFELQNRKLLNKKLQEKNQSLSKQIEEIKKEQDELMDKLKLELSQKRVDAKKFSQLNEQLQKEVDGLKAKIAKNKDSIDEHKTGAEERMTHIRNFYYSTIKKRDDVDVPCDKDLGVIAQNLSKALTDFEPCRDCCNLLPDLATAARYIKQLTEMVDEKFKGKDDENAEEKDNLEEVESGASIVDSNPEEIGTPIEEIMVEKEEASREDLTLNDEDKSVESLKKEPIRVNKADLVKEISEKVVELVKNQLKCICFKTDEEKSSSTVLGSIQEDDPVLNAHFVETEIMPDKTIEETMKEEEIMEYSTEKVDDKEAENP